MSRNPSQCGPCVAGYTAEILITGETATICKKSLEEKAVEKEWIETPLTIWISVVAVVVFILGAIALFFMKKRSEDRRGETLKKWNDCVCVFGPSAPPVPENSPFVVVDTSQPRTICNNNNETSRDSNKLLRARPYNEPDWIRTNPNYGQHFDDAEVSEPTPAPQLPPEEDTNPSSWTPEQLSIQVPPRPFSQFSSEQRDNVMNANLDESCPVVVSESAGSSGSSGSGESRETGDRSRAPNVLISQKITMNLNVLNSDY